MADRKGDRGASFDDLMARMGVRRLDERPTPTRTGRKSDGKRGSSTARRSKQVAPSPAPPRPVSPSEAPTERLVVAPMAEAPTEAVTERVPPRAGAAESRVTAAEAERDSLRERLASVEEELVAATERARAAEARLERREGAPVPDLLELMSAHGIRGRDEAARTLRALADARLLDSVLTQLQPVDPVVIGRVLDARVQRLGGCEACPAALPGRAVLEVPRSRCEVCGGQELARLVRGFVDGMLNNGLRHAVIIGGSAKQHQQLRAVVSHHRLVLDLVPASSSAPVPEDTDLVVAWVGQGADAGRLEAYEHTRTLAVRVDGPELHELLSGVARALRG